MTDRPKLNEREQQMLDLLAAGENVKNISKAMDIRHTTARTYLSGLYKKIGVANKTEAAAWWTAHKAAIAARFARPYYSDAGSHRKLKPSFEFAAELTFGDHALENGLLAALGSLSVYVGQNVRCAQASRAVPPVATQSARLSGLHWLYERLMARDWATAIEKWAEFDEDLKEAHSYLVIECMHLLMNHRDRTPTLSLQFEEKALYRRAREWLLESRPGACDELEDMAAKGLVGGRDKHLALIVLFFGFESIGDLPRAVDAANALMVDAMAGRIIVEDEAKWDFVPKPLNQRDTTLAPIALPLSRKKVAA